MCRDIKREAVEDVKRGRICPKQDIDRYVMKDVWFLLIMTSGTRKHLWRPERRWYQYARCEELRIGWEFELREWKSILQMLCRKIWKTKVGNEVQLEVQSDNDSLIIWIVGSTVVILLTVVRERIARNAQEEHFKAYFVQTIPSQASFWAHRHTLEVLVLSPYS